MHSSDSGGIGSVTEGAAAKRADRWIFFCFLILLVWAPIPLGSKIAWASSLLDTGLYALAMAWLALYALNLAQVPHAFRRAWPALALFGGWLLLLCVQVLPLPEAAIALLSHGSMEAGREAQPWMRSHGPAAVISVDPEASWEFLSRSLAYAAAFGLTLVLAHSRDRLQTLALVLVGSGVFQATLGSFLHLAGARYELFNTLLDHSTSAMGTFANRDHFAGYMEMTLAVGIGMMIATLRGGGPRTWRQALRDWTSWLLSPRVLLRLMLVVMVIALVMTRSRMGNSAFFVSMLVAGAIGLALSRHATRSTVILLVSLVVIDIFVVGAWFGVEKVIHRLEQTSLTRSDKARDQASGKGQEQSVEERAEPGLMALKALKEFPFVGSGGGTFYVVFPKYREQEIDGWYDHGHNDYVQFATETGVLGVGLVGLLVLATFLVALKTQYQRRDPLARGVAFGVTMGIIALMIHSWVDFNLQRPANALSFVVLLAMGWAAQTVGRHGQE